MDSQTIAALVNTLGPIILPIIVNAIIWAFNKATTSVSPGTAKFINPFLPILAGAMGAAGNALAGGTITAGVVGGLAATGLHQAVTQPQK